MMLKRPMKMIKVKFAHSSGGSLVRSGAAMNQRQRDAYQGRATGSSLRWITFGSSLDGPYSDKTKSNRIRAIRDVLITAFRFAAPCRLPAGR